MAAAQLGCLPDRRPFDAVMVSARAGSIPRCTRPPIRYRPGAIVTVWPTTCRSRHRLSCLNEVLPPCQRIRSSAARALPAAETATARG
jgi:hypothetical protein